MHLMRFPCRWIRGPAACCHFFNSRPSIFSFPTSHPVLCSAGLPHVRTAVAMWHREPSVPRGKIRGLASGSVPHVMWPTFATWASSCCTSIEGGGPTCYAASQPFVCLPWIHQTKVRSKTGRLPPASYTRFLDYLRVWGRFVYVSDCQYKIGAS